MNSIFKRVMEDRMKVVEEKPQQNRYKENSVHYIR